MLLVWTVTCSIGKVVAIIALSTQFTLACFICDSSFLQLLDRVALILQLLAFICDVRWQTSGRILREAQVHIVAR